MKPYTLAVLFLIIAFLFSPLGTAANAAIGEHNINLTNSLENQFIPSEEIASKSATYPDNGAVQAISLPPEASEGRAFLYYGNNGVGLHLLPQ